VVPGVLRQCWIGLIRVELKEGERVEVEEEGRDERGRREG